MLSQIAKIPLISIIVPIYKVEKYLQKCLESILQQTYTNLEIILIDDGSPDNCPQICDAYAAKDSRIKVIHKTNGGLSSARNAGLNIAKGEWIGFVDSDDWIMPDMYEKLYCVAKCENADLAICGYRCIDENDRLIDDISPTLKYEVLTKLDALKNLVGEKGGAYVISPNKIYVKRIFNNIRFPIGKFHEDQCIIHYIIDRCEKIVVISNILYMYVQRKDSIMGIPYSIKRFDACDAYIDRYNFLKSKGLYSHAKVSLRGAYGILIMALKQLDIKLHKEKILPYYKNIFWLLLKMGDLRAVKLFIYRYKRILL